MIEVKVKQLNSEDIPLPRYMTNESAGMDLYAAVENDILIKPGEIKLIPTGIALELPSGYEAQLRPRSGLAIKKGITLLNSPGTIDSDYRGEIKIILINHGKENVIIRRKERIAQMVFCPVAKAKLIVVNELSNTDRGNKGFGHTGMD